MSRWKTIYKVQPSAAVFPMMSEAELGKLAEDIGENGLKVPIVVCMRANAEGVFETYLVDGRNRLEAAERAGISRQKIVRMTNEIEWDEAPS